MTITTATSGSLEDSIINFTLRNSGTLPSASQTWLALYTTDPTDADVGIELSGSAYARAALPPDTAAMRAAGHAWTVTERTAKYKYVINFPLTSASWGWVSYVGIRTASTGGSLIFYGPLSASVSVDEGDVFSIYSNTLEVDFGQSYSLYLANGLFNQFLNGVNITPPGLNVFAALYTHITSASGEDTPRIAPAGNAEVSASAGYTRARISGTKSWTSPSNGSTANLIVPVFSTYATADWGTIEGMALVYADSEARTAVTQLLFQKCFNPYISVFKGDGVRLDLDMLQVTLD